MQNRTCEKGKIAGKDLQTIREAVRLAGLHADFTSIESGAHFVSINGAVEIQPLMFDCRGELETPSWIVRRLNGAESGEMCSCGVATRGGEVGTYNNLQEAIATAIAEVVRLKVLAGLNGGAAGTAAGNSKAFANDFIRHSLH